MHESAALNDTGLIDTGNWETLLCQGAQEVFEMMIGVPLRRCAAGRSAGGRRVYCGDRAGGAGEWRVRLALRFADRPWHCLRDAGRGRSGGQGRGVGRAGRGLQHGDWKLQGQDGRAGASSALSVPTVIHGHDYRVRPLINGSFVECRMETGDGALHLRLDYRLA